MAFNAQQKGMTLLELLVVMVILAMVSALLVQGMGTALVTYERVQRSQQNAMQPELAYGWLRQTLQGAQAELHLARQFTGNEHSLKGMTHQPLIGTPGQMRPFEWQLAQGLQGKLELSYRQPNIKWPVLAWPAGTTGRFVYRTLKGAAVTQWPTLPDDVDEPDGRMPTAILLEITPPHSDMERWYITMPGRNFPRGDYRDF